MTNRYRAGQPCTPQMDCASSGCNGPVEGECIGICSLHRIPHPKPLPVEMHEPDLSLRDKFIKLLGEWK